MLDPTQGLGPVSKLPVTVKVPALLAILMIAVSILVSERVMTRLNENQERHLRELAGAYLDGLSSSIQPFVIREDIWEVFDSLDRAQALYAGLKPLRTVVINDAGKVIAALNPREFPAGVAVPPGLLQRFARNKPIFIDHKAGRGFALRHILVQNKMVGSIYAELDIADLLAERSTTRQTLFITNALLTILLTTVGYFAVRHTLHPLKTLSSHLNSGIDGQMARVPDYKLGSPKSEFGQLFRRYNAMVDAINERERLSQMLAEEERLASIGLLTSGIAHDINNPLAGMFNTLDALKRYGERPSVRVQSVQLLERGLQGIRDIVRAALLTYRPSEDQQITAEHFDDLRLLVRPQLQKRALRLNWRNDISGTLGLPAHELRHAVLNLLVNACGAAKDSGEVSFQAQRIGDSLSITVADDGEGLPVEFKRYLEHGSAAAPLEMGRGLGLWMVRRCIDHLQGSVTVGDRGEGGTAITLSIPCRKGELQNVA